ncbi:unnamed protein product, partial [Nippostrongylus brasiliensis]|uniref:DNA polymerase delta subunit 3 n=1 Tax=Nippostrongylus brasiliensis TaxID=27835 RepID=A0A0N4YS43_NIPBR
NAFLEKLRSVRVYEDGLVFESFDVTALYTNVSNSEALQAVHEIQTAEKKPSKKEKKDKEKAKDKMKKKTKKKVAAIESLSGETVASEEEDSSSSEEEKPAPETIRPVPLTLADRGPEKKETELDLLDKYVRDHAELKGDDLIVTDDKVNGTPCALKRANVEPAVTVEQGNGGGADAPLEAKIHATE